MSEPERLDGRKTHYGAGRQPLDDIVDMGWGPAFCAGNIVKYLRRNKQIEDSRAKARWYWLFMVDKAKNNGNLPMLMQCPWTNTMIELRANLLTDREVTFLTTGLILEETAA